MRDFLTLLKYELKMQFSFKKKKNFDFVGLLTSFLISLLIIVVFVFLIAQVVGNYVDVKIDKIADAPQRALELLNIFYALIIIAMSALGVERMRKVLSQKKDKAIFLRLPIQPQTIFLSKLVVLLIMNYITAFFLIVPVNVIFFISLEGLAWTFWLKTIVVWLFLPMVPFLISSLILIPYIKIIDFLKNKYLIVFIIFTLTLIGAFLLYSELLEIVQKLLETGNIKFLFNEKFIITVQSIYKFSYPANSLASILIGKDNIIAYLIVIVVTIINILVTYIITKNLFYITLYKNDDRVINNKPKEKFEVSSPIVAFLKKEFIMVFREPAHVFSYFAIACSMPVMVYSCFTLFQSLIINTLGLKIEFSLSVLIILIFSVLTNTFCSTNISRDGLSILKTKAMPIKATNIVLSKVIFCSVVSSAAVILSGILLIIATELIFIEGLVCIILGVIFSLGQIFIATKLDLNHAKVSASPDEIEKESSKTIAKVISIGLLMSILVGIGTIVFSVFATAKITDGALLKVLVYLFPILMCLVFFICSFFYCKFKLEKKFNELVM